MMMAKSALRYARIFRMLWPQPQSTAKRASPSVPLRGDRDRQPSVFMWPISASMALRRRRSAISFGVRPRLVPLISTRVFRAPWPRYPRSTTARSGWWIIRVASSPQNAQSRRQHKRWSTCSQSGSRCWGSRVARRIRVDGLSSPTQRVRFRVSGDRCGMCNRLRVIRH